MATHAQAVVTKLDVQPKEVHVSRSLTQMALRRLRHDYLTLIALSIIIVITALSFAAPLVTNVLGVSPTRTQTDKTFLPPGSPVHIFGTDDLGRDHLARLLYAGQISLKIAFSAAALSLTIGVALGIITGYYGGVIDDMINWLIATLTSVPILFLLLIISSVLRSLSDAPPSDVTLIIALGFIGWTGTTRIVRGETLSLREREYVLSARAVGASSWRIMFVHMLPNLISVIIITLAIDIGSLILVEAALSFLGLGVMPPTPSWGNMLSNSQTFFNKGVWLVIFPGLLIFITVLCMYVMGDGIRDAFDPTARN
ncbi:MAG: ABC transporter permease [Chloroflexota bacterium]|nr:ABC transporter permease [Chloroflexota bacterium]